MRVIPAKAAARSGRDQCHDRRVSVVSMALATQLSLLLFAVASLSSAAASPVQIGQALYREGVAPDGAKLRARTAAGTVLEGQPVACARCHRRSGQGSTEGSVYVPPITAEILFNPRRFDRAELIRERYMEPQDPVYRARIHSPRSRAAYDRERLRRLLEHGVDPSGRELPAAMPRYRLAPTALDALIKYLRTLGERDSPGVDETFLHLATVTTEATPDRIRGPMLKVMREYLEWRNRDIMRITGIGDYSPYYKDDFTSSLRIWSLEEWRLQGPPETWAEQLQAFHEQQPALALVGGHAEPWAPLQAFCEATETVCLYPFVELPGPVDTAHFSVYYSRGLGLEAEVAGAWLAGDGDTPPTVAQLYRPEAYGRVPARALRRALTRRGIALAVDRELGADESMNKALTTLRRGHADLTHIAVWPGMGESAAVVPPQPAGDGPLLLLPSHAFDSWSESERDSASSRVRIVYRYQPPGTRYHRMFKVNQWMGMRGIEVRNRRLQFNTWFALELLRVSLKTMLDNYQPEYLLERVEHETEAEMNVGFYPRLRLGPGQRIASKGAYILAPGPDGFEPASDWIVP